MWKLPIQKYKVANHRLCFGDHKVIREEQVQKWLFFYGKLKEIGYRKMYRVIDA